MMEKIEIAALAAALVFFTSVVGFAALSLVT